MSRLTREVRKGSGEWRSPGALSALADSLFSLGGSLSVRSESNPREDRESDGRSPGRDLADAADTAEIPEETLYRLVVDHDGRMRQSSIVETTSWSPSRVSRRLANLENAGWVRRVRQGRENVVIVPGST
jgi:hypothetical protein